jgi:hypothetical protein
MLHQIRPKIIFSFMHSLIVGYLMSNMLSTRTKHKYNAVMGKEWDNRDTNYRLPHWKLWRIT